MSHGPAALTSRSCPEIWPLGSDALDVAVGPQQQQTDYIGFSQLYLTDLDYSNFNAGNVPSRVYADTAPNGKLPTVRDLSTITTAMQMGTGWGNPRVLSRGVLG